MHFSRLAAALLFWPSLLLIVWGELTPSPPQLDGIFGWDKAEHFIAYFGLAAMTTVGLGLRRRLAWAIIALVAFSGALEILQGYTGRDPEIMDFLANALGAVCGLGIGVIFLRVLRPRALAGVPPGH